MSPNGDTSPSLPFGDTCCRLTQALDSLALTRTQSGLRIIVHRSKEAQFHSVQNAAECGSTPGGCFSLAASPWVCGREGAGLSAPPAPAFEKMKREKRLTLRLSISKIYFRPTRPRAAAVVRQRRGHGKHSLGRSSWKSGRAIQRCNWDVKFSVEVGLHPPHFRNQTSAIRVQNKLGGYDPHYNHLTYRHISPYVLCGMWTGQTLDWSNISVLSTVTPLTQPEVRLSCHGSGLGST